MDNPKSQSSTSTKDTSTAPLEKMFTELGIKQRIQEEFEVEMTEMFNQAKAKATNQVSIRNSGIQANEPSEKRASASLSDSKSQNSYHMTRK